eukprot:gene10878-3582_t
MVTFFYVVLVDSFFDFGNYLIGRGKNVYTDLIQNPILFKRFVRLEIEEFNQLLFELPNFYSEIKCLGFKNKILLVLSYIAHYHEYLETTIIFQISCSSISKILQEMLPYLYNFFIQFVPNKKESQIHFTMSDCTAFIIDGTTHPITRTYPQELYYRNDKCCHFRQTMLLVDFEGKIIRVITNILREISGQFGKSNSYAISDSKFYNCDNVVVGYSQPQLKRKKIETSSEPSKKRKKFDKTARTEQRKIEHVNNFLKICLLK